MSSRYDVKSLLPRLQALVIVDAWRDSWMVVGALFGFFAVKLGTASGSPAKSPRLCEQR